MNNQTATEELNFQDTQLKLICVQIADLHTSDKEEVIISLLPEFCNRVKLYKMAAENYAMDRQQVIDD